jgi:membrane glycosyltransferase
MTPSQPQIHQFILPERLRRRRALFYTSVFLLTSLATWFMADILWRDDLGFSGIEWVLLVLFVILIAQVAVGFVTAMLGFYVINRGGDRQRITRTVDWGTEDVPLASTAIVMPVFNEDVSRVLEGLRVIYRSLDATKKLEQQAEPMDSGGGRLDRTVQTGQWFRAHFLSETPSSN